jgi:integrase
MVFLAEGGKTYKVKLADRRKRGRYVTLSTGVQDEAIAKDVERMVDGFKAQRKWAYYDALVEKLVPLGEAYDHHVAGDLDAFMATALAKRDVVDLDPLVTTWEKEGANPKYVMQVRRFIPAGIPFPLENFRVKTISGFLAGLTVANAGEDEKHPRKADVETRRRYKTAISRFAAFLIQRELIEQNPTRSVELPKRKIKPIRYLEPDEVKAGVLATTGLYRVATAIAAGGAVEYQSLEPLRKRDVKLDERMVHANGGKTEYRDRWVEITEDWAWEIIAAHVKTLLTPATKLFPDLTEKKLLDEWKAALTAAELPYCTVHELRHAFAVMWIDRGAAGGLRADGRDLNWLKNQLGHSERSVLVFTTYGVQIKAARLTAKQQARLAPKEARK